MAWLSGWDKRIKLDIDYTNKIGASVTWLPVIIHLKDANGDSTKVFEEVGANSRKIAITKADGETELKGEIEQWSYDSETPANSVGIIHTSATGWTIDEDMSIYLYYDSTHDDNANIGDDPDDAASNAVWDGNFKMVQHLKNNTTSTTKDSTSNNNDGTKRSANNPLEADAKIGKGQNFSNDYIQVADAESLDITDAITLEIWLKGGTQLDYAGLLTKWGDAGADENYAFYYFKTTEKFFFTLNVDGVGLSSTTSPTMDGSVWYYLVATYDKDAISPQVKLYLDTILESSSTYTTAITTGGSPVKLGLDQSNVNYFAGIIDETRISATARSAAWIKGSYNSGNDSLLTYGSEEEEPIVIEPPAMILDIEGAVPSLSISELIEPPAFNLDIEGGIPTLDLSLVIEPPAMTLDIEAGIPTIVPSLTVDSPSFNLNIVVGIPTLSRMWVPRSKVSTSYVERTKFSTSYASRIEPDASAYDERDWGNYTWDDMNIAWNNYGRAWSGKISTPYTGRSEPSVDYDERTKP